MIAPEQLNMILTANAIVSSILGYLAGMLAMRATYIKLVRYLKDKIRQQEINNIQP